jgi:hypothetical protein
MGYSYNAYIGPILRIDGIPEKAVETEEDYCAHCDVYFEDKQIKYCPTCGEKIETKIQSSSEALDIWEILEEEGLDDCFYVDEEQTVILLADGSADYIENSDEDEGIQSIPVDKGNAFDKLLPALNAKDIMYSVTFGVFSYYS